MSERIAAITGANRGIGHELVRQLAAAGDIVILTARDATRAESAAGELTTAGDVIAYGLDVTSATSASPWLPW